jgi:hypothetical protein
MIAHVEGAIPGWEVDSNIGGPSKGRAMTGGQRGTVLMLASKGFGVIKS